MIILLTYFFIIYSQVYIYIYSLQGNAITDNKIDFFSTFDIGMPEMRGSKLIQFTGTLKNILQIPALVNLDFLSEYTCHHKSLFVLQLKNKIRLWNTVIEDLYFCFDLLIVIICLFCSSVTMFQIHTLLLYLKTITICKINKIYISYWSEAVKTWYWSYLLTVVFDWSTRYKMNNCT